jgi:hypothetical protein
MHDGSVDSDQAPLAADLGGGLAPDDVRPGRMSDPS